MIRMKKFSIVFLMVMFLANTVAVSAWAKPCAINDTEKSEMASNSDIGNILPCHEENMPEKQDPTKCCEGICLCLHISSTQMLLLTDYDILLNMVLRADSYNLYDESTPSRDTSPSHPPPIYIS